jgi:transposase
MLKRDESTIYRWLKTYKQGGITGLLTVKKAPGRLPIFHPKSEKNNQKTARTTGGDKLWQITAMARKRVRD